MGLKIFQESFPSTVHVQTGKVALVHNEQVEAGQVKLFQLTELFIVALQPQGVCDPMEVLQRSYRRLQPGDSIFVTLTTNYESLKAGLIFTPILWLTW